MAETKEATKKLPEELVEKTKEIFLAGLGLFATIEEEGSQLFNKFVEKGKEFSKKGEELEEKGKKLAEEKKEEVSKKVEDYVKAVESKIRSTLENVGIIAPSELKELEKKVDNLAVRLESIEKKLEKTTKATASKN